MMSELVFRFLEPTDLEDRKLAQPRIKLALEADIAAEAAEGARHVGRIDQQLVQIGVALEHVAIFGRDLVGLEIGKSCHCLSPCLGLFFCFWLFRCLWFVPARRLTENPAPCLGRQLVTKLTFSLR